jgi:hypothetical protein
MSDEPFLPPQPPLISAVKARNLARSHKAMADHLRAEGDIGGARLSDQQSAWWMQYAIALSQIPPGRVDMDGAP